MFKRFNKQIKTQIYLSASARCSSKPITLVPVWNRKPLAPGAHAPPEPPALPRDGLCPPWAASELTFCLYFPLSYPLAMSLP